MKLLNTSRPKLTLDTIKEYIVWDIRRRWDNNTSIEHKRMIVSSVLDYILKRGGVHGWTTTLDQLDNGKTHIHIQFTDTYYTIGFVDMVL